MTFLQVTAYGYSICHIFPHPVKHSFPSFKKQHPTAVIGGHYNILFKVNQTEFFRTPPEDQTFRRSLGKRIILKGYRSAEPNERKIKRNHYS